ncbi:MAG: 2-C-methyl-D-erythritol 4-phosphate cytidylyltransferase [Bacteroidales bacterium]|nr:2-C-methyl-D-erythritol 4-phosphate cytidylyltransferase [Bacteroidales bacterium]
MIYHIVVAAGSGSRFGANLPKQFCLLEGRPVVMHTIDRLRHYGQGGEVVLVLSAAFEEPWREMCQEHGFVSPRVVRGGSTRWESVKNAIESLPADADIITVHDGARPLVTEALMHNVLGALQRGAAGAIPVVPVTDSLRRVRLDGESTAMPRSAFRSVQTPQGFQGAVLREAYKQPFAHTFTDDASVVEALGEYPLQLVDGDWRNIKITYPLDIEVAKVYLHSLPHCPSPRWSACATAT